MEKKCKNCIGWQRDGLDGICKRFAPHPTILSKGEEKEYLIVWPRTDPDEGCYADFIPFEINKVSNEA